MKTSKQTLRELERERVMSVINLEIGKHRHQVKVALLFVSLNHIGVVCCCPEPKPTKAKKIG